MTLLDRATLDRGGFKMGSQVSRVLIFSGVDAPSVVDDGSVPSGSMYLQKVGVTWKKAGATWLPAFATPSYFLYDKRPSGEDGSEMVSYEWNVRAITSSDGAVVLNNDVFEVPPGVYEVQCDCAGGGKLRVFDKTTQAALMSGIYHEGRTTFMTGKMTIKAGMKLVIQHWSDDNIELEATKAGSDEVYLILGVRRAG